MKTRFSATGAGRALLIFAIFFILPGFILSQTTPSSLTIKAKAISTGDKIIVRWVPADYETWKWCNESRGYTLERMSIEQNGSPLTVDEQLASKVVLGEFSVLDSSAFSQMADSSDLAGVAAGTIYGDSLEVQTFDSVDFVKAYNLDQQQENRFAFSLFAADQSFEVAVAMGLAYEDLTAVDGMTYLYTVRPKTVPNGTQITSGATMCNRDEILQLLAPPEIMTRPGDSITTITWSVNALEGQYSSYILEKSSDGGATFEKVNNLPLIGTEGNEEYMSYSDSLQQNGFAYVYRVRGLSPFGLTGPPSDTVHAIGRPDPVSAFPAIVDIKEEVSGTLKIYWEFPTEFDSKIQEFEIYRGESREGSFQKINSSSVVASARSFVDSSPQPTNYYYVEAIDENNYRLPSFPFLGQTKDETPPAPPKKIYCSSDKSGRVTINWDRSESDDVMGYRVFTSTVPTGDFVQITSLWVSDTFYFDQLNLNTLSEEAYYKVLALDFRENQSALSGVCVVDRPDVIPPSPPNITVVRPSVNGIEFEWALSSSEDAVEYDFQRKPAGQKDWANIFQFNAADSIPSGFNDTTANKRKKYEYRLLVYDEAGNVSSSAIVRTKRIDDGMRDSIINFTATHNQGTGVYLFWQYPLGRDPDLMGFQIFRAINQDPIRPFKFIPIQEVDRIGQNYVWLDADIFGLPTSTATTISTPPNNVVSPVFVANPQNPSTPKVINPNSTIVSYQLMAKFFDGATSYLSPVVVVIVQ